MMSREGLPDENVREEFPQVANFRRYEKFEPVLPDHVRALPPRQMQKVIIAIGDMAAGVEGHANNLGVAKQIGEVHAA